MIYFDNKTIIINNTIQNFIMITHSFKNAIKNNLNNNNKKYYNKTLLRQLGIGTIKFHTQKFLC
jgi:hypothetical protein